MPSSVTSGDLDHARTRLKLYLLVMLIIDVVAYASDGITLLLGNSLPEVALQYAIMRWSCTALMAGAWTAVKLTRPTRWTLVALEAAVTLSLVFVYIKLGIAYLSGSIPAFAPVFPLLGIVLLLSVRGALVPSSALRTALVGGASMVLWAILAIEPLAALDYAAREGLVFLAGASIIATSVTSHVIYGLRRQVRHAMMLGQYELGRKIGEGGMGVVYEARHIMLRRPTAVKLLPTDRVGELALARFEREVQQTSRLEHPNSVYIYDYGRTPDGQFYYAMEYLDGVTLAELVELGGPLPANRAVNLLRQAAHALAEAHELGLVHRDIKPANIMICERALVPDTVKVLDFGLVKTIDNPDADSGTHADTLVGTPHYLAPESISSPEEVGPAADIYALGAVAFFLVTGREVFPGSSVIEVCAKHLEAAPEAPSALLDDPIDPAFEALILRCLAKAPEERPCDGAALASELDALTLEEWTDATARAWWRDHKASVAHSPSPPSPQPTQLAIDVTARR